jgi:predicted nicotinamide N-methyase
MTNAPLKATLDLPAHLTRDWTKALQVMHAFIVENTLPQYPPLVPELNLYLVCEINPLWRATEALLAKQNIPPPFWCFAWPGGQALARYILDNPDTVRGKRVFDFASGSGLVALACKKAGAAHVTANDVDPIAITAIGMNAKLNNLDIEVLHDNRMGKPLPDYDVILAGDFCYEWPMAGYAVEWLRSEVAAGREVLFADPGRPHAPRTGIEEIARYTVPTTTEVEDSTSKSTGLFRLGPEE